MGSWGTTEKTRYPGIYKVTHEGKRRASVRYVVSYRLRGVGQRTKTFDRLGEAQTFQAQTRDPEKARKLRAREKGRVPVADYFTAWVREHNGIRPTTRRRYEDVGRMYVAAYPIGNLNLSDLRREHVKTWIASMEAAGVGRPTIDKAHRTLRACLSEAVKDDKLEREHRFGHRYPEGRQTGPLLPDGRSGRCRGRSGSRARARPATVPRLHRRSDRRGERPPREAPRPPAASGCDRGELARTGGAQARPRGHEDRADAHRTAVLRSRR
jgi:hypothetical protein